MIDAWVLYYDFEADRFRFESRTGNAGFDSTKPEDWGLSPTTKNILVQQRAQFISAWLEGDLLKP